MLSTHDLDKIFAPYKDASQLAIAVSGGSDSLALLVMAIEWQKITTPNGPKLTALTVDHGLRDEARHEAKYVAQFCETHKISHKILTWHHKDNAKPKSAIAEQARNARYNLLAGAAQKIGCKTVLLAHTQNDQAETLLMRALHQKKSPHRIKGAGFRGLSAISKKMHHESGIKFERPLLDYSRQSLRNVLTAKTIEWIEDPSNENLTFERPRIRLFLQQKENQHLTPHLVQLAKTMSRWRQKTAIDTAKMLDTHASAHKNSNGEIKTGVLRLDYGFFEKSPPTVALLGLRAILASLGGKPYLPSLEKTQNLLDKIAQGNFMGATLSNVILRPNERQNQPFLELYREERNIAPITIEKTDKNFCFDGRFKCHLYKAPQHELPLTMRAIGEEGFQYLKAVNHPICEKQSRAHLLSQPSIWRENLLVDLPLFNDKLDLLPQQILQIDMKITPYLPAFQRFENPLDAPLSKILQTLMDALNQSL